MSTALTYTGTLTPTSCWCGIAVAVPSSLLEEAQAGHTSIYCPVGHKFTWKGENTTEAKLRRLLETERRRSANAIEREDAVRRRLTAAKGQQTKLRNRIKAGVCPCCSRSFENLQRHIASQHPTFGAETPEAAS